MREKLKQASYWLSVITIGIIFGVALQFAKAWTEPTATPPAQNVGAPINTGSSAQVKAGSLTINGGTLTANSAPGTWAGYFVANGQHGLYAANSSNGVYSYLSYANYGLYSNGDVCTAMNGGKCLSAVGGSVSGPVCFITVNGPCPSGYVWTSSVWGNSNSTSNSVYGAEGEHSSFFMCCKVM